MTMGIPANCYNKHGDNVRVLESLSGLLGCHQSIGASLPDGKIPDVLRVDINRKILFIGDAKYTETPGNLDTQTRLFVYLKWISAYLRAVRGSCIFAICCSRIEDLNSWSEKLSMLTYEVGLTRYDFGVESFAKDTHVIWAYFEKQSL